MIILSKKRVPTVLVGLLSLVIVFGSWFLTKELLNQLHRALVKKVNYTSAAEHVALELKAVERISIDSQKLANILQAWRLTRTPHYHDPFSGQLTMEEAIVAAKSVLFYFTKNNVLPKELLEKDFIQTNAFLYRVESVYPAPDDLDPAYSLWSIKLNNSTALINLTLNAQTGQVWEIDIVSTSQNVNFESVKVLDALELYEAFLGLSGGGGLRSREEFAVKSFDNGHIGISVEKKMGSPGYAKSLHLLLISTGQEPI